MRGEHDHPSRRVYVIDDDQQLRKSLFYLLASAGYDPWMFGSGIDFLADLPRVPGVLLLDLQMADLDGLSLAARIPDKRRPGFPVVMLTGHGDMAVAVRALRMGVRDFLEKPYCEADLLAVLHRVSAELADEVSRRDDAEEAADRLASLTPREADVLERLMQGRMNKEIAHDLGLSMRTVEMHRASLLQRIDAKSLAEALRLATASGWTNPAPSRRVAKRPD